jgi:hypothetical protein
MGRLLQRCAVAHQRYRVTRTLREMGPMIGIMGRSIQMGSVSGVSGRWIGRLCWICEVLGDTPWQQFVNTVDRVIGNIGQDMPQVSARVDTIEIAAADERVHRSCPLAPAVGASNWLLVSVQRKPEAVQRYARTVEAHLWL